MGENATLEETVKTAAAHGVHRVLVLRENEMDVVGVVAVPAAMDIVFSGRGKETAAAHASGVSFFPEVGRASELLEHFNQNPSEQLVAVVDEYGDFSGIASLEDLTEFFVGEMRDEYEGGEMDVTPLPDGGFLVPGKLPIHEWLELLGAEDALGAAADELPYSTVAGLVIYHLGRIPKPGDVVRVEGMRFSVEQVGGRRVIAVSVRADESEERGRA
ncbi:MAG TPA: hypothetical protein ENN09_01760 [Planctomycetes bacterium]|nr:hypothetical protein [Planctomycetota bacterium]